MDLIEEINKEFGKARTAGIGADERLLGDYVKELMKYKKGEPSAFDEINIQDQLLLAPPNIQKIVFLVMKFMQLLINRSMSREEFKRGMNIIIDSFAESYGHE